MARTLALPPATLMQIESVADFRLAPDAFAPVEAFLVVKSQDQLERRRRLIESVKGGRIGRFAERPVSEGLVVRARIEPGIAIDRGSAEQVWTFREPRGLILGEDGGMLVSEIDRVIALDAAGRELRDYRAPGFGFLHAIVPSRDGRRILVVSTGYDLLAELDLASGAVVWDWLTWEHGFNPNLDGVYLARDPARHAAFLERGLPARLIDFSEPSTHGLMTTARTNHPNSASYGRTSDDVILATHGHNGDLIEIDRVSGEFTYRLRDIGMMPHGIMPHGDGWMVTSTMKGECWFLDERFAVIRKLVFATLPGKPPELGANEWLQSVHPLGDGVFAGLDANRGLVLVDLARRCYTVIPVDPDWCVHLLVPDTRPAAARMA